ncbi:MAG TPA: hypothetical protein VGB42_00155 [Candidatus Thermoplasmatota archaeon]
MPGAPVADEYDSGLGAPGSIGKHAFESELLRLARHITVGGDSVVVREAGRTLARARRSLDAGDYLRAVEALGQLDLTVREASARENRLPPNAGEVEQALADVRRLLAEAELRPGHEAGVLLWQAARQAVIDGRWETAVALLDEARGRVDRDR